MTDAAKIAQNSKGSQMSDELKAWRDAVLRYNGCPIVEHGQEITDHDRVSAAVIRTYGDEGHAAGYQAAIADVVEWLLKGDPGRVEKLCARGITRRFGKDA